MDQQKKKWSSSTGTRMPNAWNGDQRQIRAWNTMRKHWVNF